MMETDRSHTDSDPVPHTGTTGMSSLTRSGSLLRSARVWGRLFRMRLRWWTTGPLWVAMLVCVVFAGSLWVIAREVRGYEYAEVWAYLQALPVVYIVLAVGLTFLTFGVLTGYDTLALQYVDVDLAPRRVIFSAFIGYAVSQAIGNPILTGGSVRYRLYSLWGISPTKVAKSILFAGISFWLGFFALGGGVLVWESNALVKAFDVPVAPTVIGLLFLLPVGAYLAVTLFREEPVSLWEWTLSVPPTWMLPVQVLLAAGDLFLASSVLFVLLPPDVGVSLSTMLVSYLVALLAGLVSHVPGGLGVFESVLLLILTPEVPPPALLSGLLAYRGIFHLFPLVLAALAFGAYELRRGFREWTDSTGG